MIPIALCALLLAQPAPGETNPPPSSSAPSPAPATAPAPPASSPSTPQRVGGDEKAVVTFKDSVYSFGKSEITTPLPDSYPAPTPPGAIDIKSYPSARAAVVSGEGDPDWGMNASFWPLFGHIKRRDIPMTSPVLMDYRGLGGGDLTPAGEVKSWSMAFLYRTAAQGATGTDSADERVKIVDVPEAQVLAVGLQGTYSMKRVRQGVEMLAQWMNAHPEWKPAGEVRAFFYQGPDTPARLLWSEVHLPIAPSGAAPLATPAPAAPQATPPSEPK